MHRTQTGCVTFIVYAEVSSRTEWEHHSFTAGEFPSSIPSPGKERIAASVTRGKERFPHSNRWTDTGGSMREVGVCCCDDGRGVRHWNDSHEICDQLCWQEADQMLMNRGRR
jgi:hypothetical protein